MISAAFRRPLQHLGIAEIIVNDHFRPLDELLCAQGDQTKIARSRADQITTARLFISCHRVSPSVAAASSSGCADSPVTAPAWGANVPSAKTCACSRNFSFVIVACTPTGESQSPSSKRRNSRSARRQSNVGWSLIARRPVAAAVHRCAGFAARSPPARPRERNLPLKDFPFSP